MSVTGVTYYKLENGYPGDVTKGCGLSGSEIDKNFHFLRGYDIKDGEILSSGGTIVLKRVNGDEIVIDGLKQYVASIVDGKEEVQINEGNSYFDKDRYELHIALDYADGTSTDFVIDGFRIEHDKIYVGDGLYGNGQIDNPLRVNPINRTGFYAPVKEFIDFSGQTVYQMPDAVPGDRYLTRERTTKYGLKYNAYALRDIARRLEEIGSDWRIPTADDWNGLLNAYEECDYKDHGSSTNSGFYGKKAGSVMKDLSWPDSNPERTELGIVPTDKDDLQRMVTSFWSSTTDKIREITIKTFIENEGRVKQSGLDDWDANFAYVRLVKDLDSGNVHDVEDIFGVPYECVQLMSEVNGIVSTKIWTKQNLYCPEYIGGTVEIASGATLDVSDEDGDWHYYINEKGAGEMWFKKELKPNECLVIESFEGQPDNSEYILTPDGELVNRTDKIIGDVFSGITSEIERLDERIDSVEDAISGETAAREEEEEEIWDAIGNLYNITSGITESVEDEINRLDGRDDEIANDIIKYGNYTINVVGGVPIPNVGEDKELVLTIDGDFSKYNPDGREGGWSLS